MLSLLEVKCPHCGARGQIMLPPVGSIIVGPCPECQGPVVVFCGRVLPLDKEMWLKGSFEEKRDHLMGILTVFLRERVGQLVSDDAAAEPAPATQDEEPEEEELGAPVQTETVPRPIPAKPISKAEADTFLNVDLKLLDDRDYFKAIFG